MTDVAEPKPERAERNGDGLYVTEKEMARRIGVDWPTLRPTIEAMDSNPKSGFPKKDKLFGNRRYWPAVHVWLDQYNRMPNVGPGREGRR
jgi:hypothetical protein